MSPRDAAPSGLNSVSLRGYLVEDVTVRTTQTGKSVANLRLRVPNGRGEPLFITAVAWNAEAEQSSELGKGDEVTVHGRLQSRSWEKDGQKRTNIEIVARSLEFAPSGREDRPDEDDVPF